MITPFQQSLDKARPHTLLTSNPKTCGSLDYRYDDTQETVRVPNIWYNQPSYLIVSYLRWKAQVKDESADSLLKYPPPKLTVEIISNIVNQYRASANLFRSEALRMEEAHIPTHPVVASHLQLNLANLH